MTIKELETEFEANLKVLGISEANSRFMNGWLDMYRTQLLDAGKTKCEAMLDVEAERVACSILQLINSLNFKVNDVLDPDVPEEAIHTANKLIFAVKEVLNKEISEQFLSKHGEA